MKLGRLLSVLFMFFVVVSCGDDRKEQSHEQPGTKSLQASKEPDHPGKLVYMQFCMSCHMMKGEGVPNLNPPLRQTELILGDDQKLIEIVLNGMQGPVVVGGEPYNGIMTKLDFLSDQQISQVLSYVRSNFGNSAAPVSEEKVKQVREQIKH